MLQNLRDKAQGWIAWIIIGLVAITFILFGTETMFQKGANEEIVAKVGKIKISAWDLDMAYKRYLNQPGSEALRQLDPVFVKKEILELLVDEAILAQAASAFGMAISSERMQMTISSIPLFISEGHFSPQLFARFLNSEGFTETGFNTFLRERLLKQQLQEGILKTSFSLQRDLDDLVKFIFQSRDIRYLTVNRSSFEKSVSVTENEIKQYYDSHRQEFLTPEKIALEYIHLSTEDLIDKYQPKEEDIEHYYKENANSFHTPERIQIEHILIALPKDADENAIKAAQVKLEKIQKELKKGISFENLANEYSDDKATSAKGGLLDWITRGEGIPAIENAAFPLKMNEISQPTKTEFGFHLIKLIGKQPAKERPLQEVRNEIVTKLKQQAAEEQLVSMADQLSEVSFDHPDSLQPAADKLGLTVQTTDLFSRQEVAKEPFLQNNQVLNAAFSDTVKNDGNNSDLLKIDNDNYIVLRVSRHERAKERPVNEVNAEIEKILVNQKTDALTLAEANKILKEIKSLSSPSKILTQFQWEEKNNILRTTNDVRGDIVENAFSMPLPSIAPQGDFKIVHLETGDYAILWLTAVKNGDIKDLSTTEIDNYRDSLSNHFGELEYALYVSALERQTKVQKNLDKI